MAGDGLLRRHRRGLAAAAVVAVVIGTLLVVAAIGSSPGRPRPVPDSGATEVVPGQPGPLALGPDGALYLSDDARSEILARSPSGRFRVVAGDGKPGFSGDGGPATDAELNRPEGLAVGADGTIYVADQGNNRIRAITPDGRITTVVGDGKLPATLAPPLTTEPATEVAIGAPTAVAIGPSGVVYVAAGPDLLELEPGGELGVVDTGVEFDAADPGVLFQQECYPASLAVDTAGDLYIGCSSPWVLLERSPDGTLHELGQVRPHDAWAALAPVPTGGVLVLAGASVVAYGTVAQRPDSDFLAYRLPGGGFFWPQGIAVLRDGTLFLDQDGVSGIGPPALIEQSPGGSVAVLWRGEGP